MIICHCRVISDRDYDCDQKLLQRLLQSDRVCNRCIQLMKKIISSRAEKQEN